MYSCLYLLFFLAHYFCRKLSFSDCHPCFHYCILFRRISDWCLGATYKQRRWKELICYDVWCIVIEHFFLRECFLVCVCCCGRLELNWLKCVYCQNCEETCFVVCFHSCRWISSSACSIFRHKHTLNLGWVFLSLSFLLLFFLSLLLH